MSSFAVLALLHNLLITKMHAHEGGHHPTVTDGGRYGGLIAPLVEEHHDHHGHHEHEHESKFKAELVRGTDLSVYVYIYKDGMNPADTKILGNDIQGAIVSGSGKKKKLEDFTLKLAGKSYTGKSPKINERPYTMEFKITIEGKKLTASFTNLD